MAPNVKGAKLEVFQLAILHSGHRKSVEIPEPMANQEIALVGKVGSETKNITLSNRFKQDNTNPVEALFHIVGKPRKQRTTTVVGHVFLYVHSTCFFCRFTRIVPKAQTNKKTMVLEPCSITLNYVYHRRIVSVLFWLVPVVSDGQL